MFIGEYYEKIPIGSICNVINNVGMIDINVKFLGIDDSLGKMTFYFEKENKLVLSHNNSYLGKVEMIKLPEKIIKKEE